MVRKKKIKKLLVANRGEIAVRIIRAAWELGIPTVAVYSDADRNSMAVRMAQEAVNIGPPPANESYLVIQKIIDACKKTGANAVHPGYGFLAENAEFAKKLKKARIMFVGPPPEAIQKMGEKAVAKEIMKARNVPVTPGSEGEIKDAAEARKLARKIGYPVMLKASAGGGGRGMRRVDSAEQLESQLNAARSEAMLSFGSEAVLMEKFIENPRHIEFQVLADQHGNVVHLGERDCTLQRRHQKLLEEAPSPFLTPGLREEMGKVACEAARAVGYVGAGTVEFLMDRHKNYFFMEMNTRIQVEHPVTEMVTGIDLIREMIHIAEGEPISFRQEDIKIQGHSIECRINAEDPWNNFMPHPGKVTDIRLPDGFGVRVDTCVFPGFTIPRQYDSMIAKLIVHDNDRDMAIRKMIRCLGEMKIDGVRTTAGFHLAMMRHESFKKGDFDTGFIEREFENLKPAKIGRAEQIALAVAIQTFVVSNMRTMAEKKEAGDKAGSGVDPWVMSGRYRRFSSRNF